MSGDDWRAAGGRIDALIAAGDAPARERAEDLVRLVADLYGAGLQRLLELAHAHGALSDDLLDAIAGDDLVASLLLVHGLHPYDVTTRVERALAAFGHLEILSLGTVVRVRVLASQDPAAVREAIEAAAPEVEQIHVEHSQPVIPVSALYARVAERR
ncbi:hypothetical protein [Paractinoplanes atraurantiacus]|uniref:Uncharacterized protein n=1 Tax=Paractinoplanes atraurantiacus TaxID=1036182 RepID=A0A285J6Q5_9ACTN|nr:hypothetical protein [Actinoplanes atraurantiacus]SNY54781.1 hypothetical protein SAMN05421748_115156 [Actinoplanes atraurantiacus]